MIKQFSTNIWLRRYASPKNWHKVKNFQSDSGKDLVDPALHLEKFPARSELLEDGDPVEVNNGISRKVVQKIGDNTVMYKPYHSKIESHSRSWMKHNIHGWASLTTKALFDAAQIGKSAEDVSASIIDDVPVTVHNFSKGFQTVDAEQEKYGLAPMTKTPAPLQVQQIAIMDYLTANLDRHGGNLMVSSSPNETGHHDLLAIDHERNFQYQKTLPEYESMVDGRANNKREIPHSYINRNGMDKAFKATYNFEDEQALHAWWIEVSPTILQTFEEHLVAIKDERLRNFIRANFMTRFNVISEWASEEEIPHSHQNQRLFSAEFPQIENKKMEPIEKGSVENILARLPENKQEAVFFLSKALGRKRSRKTQDKLQATLTSLLNMLTPDQKTKLLVLSIERRDLFGSDGQRLFIDIFKEILESGDKETARMLLAKDDESAFLFPYWRQFLEKL